MIMKLIDFEKYYPDEQTCKESFRQYRMNAGVTCRKCGNTKHYWMKSIEQFQCTECRFRTTLKSGTVMEDSNLPFRVWFFVLHLMTSTTKGFSAKEVQRQLGFKRYEPIWYLMQKIRTAMGERDDKYLLKGACEMDEGFFSTVESERRGKPRRKLKRGRGSEKKSTVLVMAESKKTKSKKRKNRPSTACGHVKMKVMPNMNAETVESVAKAGLAPEVCLKTDDYTSYSKLRNIVQKHTPRVVEPSKADKVLPWVHIIISNAKRNLLNNFHHIDDRYLQNYLNEYTYKLNRRYLSNQLFEHALIACASFSWFALV